MTVKEMRELTGLSQQKFGDRYHIPLRTIQHWEAGTRECPVYVKELLEFKVVYDSMDSEERYPKALHDHSEHAKEVMGEA